MAYIFFIINRHDWGQRRRKWQWYKTVQRKSRWREICTSHVYFILRFHSSWPYALMTWTGFMETYIFFWNDLSFKNLLVHILIQHTHTHTHTPIYILPVQINFHHIYTAWNNEHLQLVFCFWDFSLCLEPRSFYLPVLFTGYCTSGWITVTLVWNHNLLLLILENLGLYSKISW